MYVFNDGVLKCVENHFLQSIFQISDVKLCSQQIILNFLDQE